MSAKRWVRFSERLEMRDGANAVLDSPNALIIERQLATWLLTMLDAYENRPTPLSAGSSAEPRRPHE
jgi:hypothetical protein